MQRFDLDLTQPAFEKRRGDFVLYGAWHGQRLRPCLVLVPAYRMECTPLVIEVDDAWKWNPDDPQADPLHNARMIGRFLQANGMDLYNAFTHMKVTSFIHDHLSDLLRIPPKNTESKVVGDVFHTDHDSGKVTHKEIIERV